MNSFFTGRKLLPVAGLVTAFALSGLVAVSSTASSEVNTFQETQRQETQVTVPQVAVPDIAQEFGKKRKLRVKSFGKKKAPVIITSVRNLDADEETWMRDLEIEVKNVSRKPIYMLTLRLQFPDVVLEGKPDVKTGFGIRFNRSSHLRSIKDIASPSDNSIKPGETYTLKVPEGYVLGYKNAKKRDALRAKRSKNIIARLYLISFGDGTGFQGKQYWDSRKKTSAKKVSFKKAILSLPKGGLLFQKAGCTKAPQFSFTSLPLSQTESPCGGGICSPLVIQEDPSYQCDGGYNDEGEYVQCPFDIPAEDSSAPCSYATQELKECGDYPDGCYDTVLDETGCPDNTNCPDADDDGWTTCDGDCNDDDPDTNPDFDPCYDYTGNWYDDYNCNGVNDGAENLWDCGWEAR